MANYLYNGIALPALPDYDKTTYPYAVIGGTASGNTKWLYACSAPPYLNESGAVVCGTSTAKCLYWYFDSAYVDGWDTRGSSGITTLTNKYVFWTDTDILNTDGTIYLAASTPILVVNTAQGQSYLYNGIKLPALPEWDKTTYPYAYIAEGYGIGQDENGNADYVYSGITYLYCISSEIKVGKIGDKYGHTSLVIAKIFQLVDGEWVDKGVSPIGSSLVVWANTDVYFKTDDSLEDLSGTLYLAASEPVPVGVTPEAYTSYVHNGSWQKGTFYKRVNNAWVKHTAWRRQNGAWVKVKE